MSYNKVFFQTAKSFFEANVDNIKRTATLIAEKNGTSPDIQFQKAQEEYYNSLGNCDKESVFIVSKEVLVSKVIETIRHLPNEVLMALCYRSGQFFEVFRKEGDYSTVDNIDLQEINKAILSFRVNHPCSKMLLYFVHNHPYTYKASPSQADLITAETLINSCKLLSNAGQEIGVRFSVDFIDFGIVTDFDYWSIKQQCEKLD